MDVLGVRRDRTSLFRSGGRWPPSDDRHGTVDTYSRQSTAQGIHDRGIRLLVIGLSKLRQLC